jgi:YVTN family beta-propeller protein
MPSPCDALKFLFGAFIICSSPSFADDTSIFVTNSADDRIHVIDAATNKVVRVIEGIEGAHGICFSPDGSRIYVSNEDESALDVVDGPGGKVIKRILLSNRPNNVAATRDGRKVVVGIRRGEGALDIIDTASLTVAKTIPVSGGVHNVYVTPDDKFAVAGSITSAILTVVDLATGQIAWEYKFDKGIRPMAIEPATDRSAKRIFVQLSELNGFAVVDFTTHQEVARVILPKEPSGYGRQETRGEAPSHGIGVSPDGKTLWVTSITANAVFVYSLADLSFLGHVVLPDLRLPGRDPIGAVPNWVTFTPDGTKLFISNAALRSVSVIDTGTMSLAGTVPVGEVPKRINTLAVRLTN